jgi:aminopeptidase N
VRLFPLTTYLSLLTASAPLAAQRHDALHYEVALTLSDTDSVLRARVGIRWRLTGARPVVLDLDRALTVTSATVDARRVRWRRRGSTIVLPVTGRVSREVTTTVTSAGVPRDGLVIRGTGAGRTIFADNWPDRAYYWLASHDHPSDKASVTWRVEAPAHFGVVANGSLTGRDTLTGGMIRWRFRNPEPIPVHTMVVGVAEFEVLVLPPAACATRCVPVTVLTITGDSRIAGGPFRNATRMIDFFSERFGHFPYAELRHVQSTTRFGGMENATAIFYDTRAIHEGRLGEGTVAHETAHQWFGDAVTRSDWHDLWLSEGFASYGAALWAEHVGGDSALSATMRSARDAVMDSPVVERPIFDSAITNPTKLLNANNYQRAPGCCTLSAVWWETRRSFAGFAATSGATSTGTPSPETLPGSWGRRRGVI